MSRRLASLEKLGVREELGLGPTLADAGAGADEVAMGNRAETLVAARRAGLSGTDLRCVVDLILATKMREQVECMLSKPPDRHVPHASARSVCNTTRKYSGNPAGVS